MSRAERIIYVGFFLRIILSLISWGTNDADLWFKFTGLVQKEGIEGAYASEPMLNHPVPILLLVAGLRTMSEVTAIPFTFLLRLPGIFAEICLARFLMRRGLEGWALFIALNPVMILLSGFHANTDSLLSSLIFFSSVVLKFSGNPLLAGLAFGAAANIKLLPVLLMLPLLFALKVEQRRTFCIGAALGLIPFAFSLGLVSPNVHKQIFGYSPLPEYWGIGYVLLLLKEFSGLTASGITELSSQFQKVGSAVAVVATQSLGWFQSRCADPMRSVYGCILLILILSPGFGVQYFAWLAPFLVLLSAKQRVFAITTQLILILMVYLHYLLPEFPLHVVLTNHFPQQAALVGLIVWLHLMSLLTTEIRSAFRNCYRVGAPS